MVNLEAFMRKGGETFRVERGDEVFVAEGIKNHDRKEIKFRPRTDVRTGDWLRDDSGRRFYVYDTDVQMGFGRQPLALVASYQTEADYDATQSQHQAPAQSVTFNVQNAYHSIFGTQQHAEMSTLTFDFRTVQSELDRAEDERSR